MEGTMKKLTISAAMLFAIASLFGITGNAEATTLSTPPLFINAADAVGCNITNLATSTITVTITILDGSGDEVAVLSTALLAGQTRAKSINPVGTSDFYRCKFISSTSNIR